VPIPPSMPDLSEYMRTSAPVCASASIAASWDSGIVGSIS
jgi:hypothetical protein